MEPGVPSGPFYNASLAVAELYEEHKERLFGYAMSLARDTDRAEDLVQETFMQAMVHLALLSRLNPYQRRAWLYRVLRNRFFDQYRAEKRSQAQLDSLVQQALLDDHDHEHDPAGASSSRGLFDRVPERYRDLLRKRYALRMTSEEIGRELGIPAATVRWRLHMAAEWIRAHEADLI